MSKRGKLLYWVDMAIFLAFLVSGASGLVLWLAGPAGFQGGRNPHYYNLALGLSRGTWNDLHGWASLAMAAGVLVHLALHWSWIVRVTRRMLERPAQKGNIRKAPEACEL
ncbi:MAG: DUF4405 domain-containing protein [Anaerolineae bacterium]